MGRPGRGLEKRLPLAGLAQWPAGPLDGEREPQLLPAGGAGQKPLSRDPKREPRGPVGRITLWLLAGEHH